MISRRLHLGVRLFVEHDLLYFFIIVLLCSIVSFGSWIVRHLHLGIRVFVEHDLLCFFTIVILCSIVLFVSWIVYLVCHVLSCFEYLSRSWVKLVCNFVLLILLYDCWDHFPCWWLAELCVRLCFRVHLLSFNDGRIRVHPLSFHWWAKLITSRNCLFHVFFVLNKEFFSNYFGQCLEWFHRLHMIVTSFRSVFIYPFVSWLRSFLSFYILQFTIFYNLPFTILQLLHQVSFLQIQKLTKYPFI